MTISEEILRWRKEQRRELLARRVAVPPDVRRAWNEAITRFLVEGFPLLRTMTIGCYWPFKSEFDPRHAIRAFREKGARAALPEVLRKDAPLQFREWWAGAPMTTGRVFDLPVPDGTEIVTPDAVLVPPVGFDSRGYRLGYGGGFFDRTLAAMTPQPLKIGVGFELSRIATIHPQPHDIPMDFIVTEAGIHRVGHATHRCV
jgi:5-formyltetrahydrofolate cyclo-ligase